MTARFLLSCLDWLTAAWHVAVHLARQAEEPESESEPNGVEVVTRRVITRAPKDFSGVVAAYLARAALLLHAAPLPPAGQPMSQLSEKWAATLPSQTLQPLLQVRRCGSLKPSCPALHSCVSAVCLKCLVALGVCVRVSVFFKFSFCIAHVTTAMKWTHACASTTPPPPTCTPKPKHTTSATPSVIQHAPASRQEWVIFSFVIMQ